MVSERETVSVKNDLYSFRRDVYADFFSYLDEIIRKRLLIDGEGAGDDRRITALLKTFLKWCNSTGTEEGDRLELFLLFFLSFNLD